MRGKEKVGERRRKREERKVMGEVRGERQNGRG